MTAARANAGRTVSAGNRSVQKRSPRSERLGKVIRRTKNRLIRPRMATSGATRRDVMSSVFAFRRPSGGIMSGPRGSWPCRRKSTFLRSSRSCHLSADRNLTPRSRLSFQTMLPNNSTSAAFNRTSRRTHQGAQSRTGGSQSEKHRASRATLDWSTENSETGRLHARVQHVADLLGHPFACRSRPRRAFASPAPSDRTRILQGNHSLDCNRDVFLCRHHSVPGRIHAPGHFRRDGERLI